MSSAKPRKSVFVSSTSRDLPQHRDQAKDAILRMSMFPIVMEHLQNWEVNSSRNFKFWL